MMTTDSERRDAARRLRGLDYADLQESLICAYLDALGIEGYADWIGIAHRLADLIEPSCDRRSCWMFRPMPDVDALLALADEINDTSCDYHGELSVSLGDIWGWAQAIRDALGVSE